MVAEDKIPANAAPRAESGVADPGTALQLIREDLGDCTRCKLHKGRTNLVFGVGNPHAELMFVGEGPGADEDAQGEPFVGRAGQLLNNMIKAMGLRREDVYIANMVKCRPPGNRTPERDECETCSPFLMRQIAAIKPKVVVALGATAAKNLLAMNSSHGRTARPLVRFQTRRHSQRSVMARRAPRCHLSPRVFAARSAPEGRSVERLADGDEVSGDRASEKSCRVGVYPSKLVLRISRDDSRDDASTLSYPSNQMPEYCDVALPVPLDMVFTYRVPAEATPVVGGRVLVPFRQQRMTGIVVELHDRKPSVKIKNILSVLDVAPVLDDQLLRLGRWIADYYLAPIGEVFRTMLPLNAEFKRGVAYRITAEGQSGAASGRDVGIVRAFAAQLRRSKPPNSACWIIWPRQSPRPARPFKSAKKLCAPRLESRN